jgi:CHAT domain-containing protein
MLIPVRLKRIVLLIFLAVFCASYNAHSQTPEEVFMAKLTDIYTYSADKKKVMSIAKEMYALLEKTKSLQTYSNYYLLKQVFENQAPDAQLAKTCGDKADKLMRDMVGTDPGMQKTGIDSLDRWFTELFPGLFTNTDPENANKALAFINSYTSYKTFGNYSFIAYAFERNGDFKKAKQYYEHAFTLKTDERKEYHTHAYYIGFLARSGEYLKAEEYIRKLERLSTEAIEMLRMAYRSEATSSKLVFYLAIGDYQSYAKAAEEQYDYLSRTQGTQLPCDPYSTSRYITTAFANEMLKDYTAAEKRWKSSDSSNKVWIACMKEQYPNLKQYPLSTHPVFLMKRGKQAQLPQPVSFYIREAETYFNSFSQYADIGINYLKANHLGFLRSADYPSLFKPVLEQIKNTRNFRESTEPFSQYAYFSMRDHKTEEAARVYKELFNLNKGWINDIIFTFGEKAFVTYYNSKLKAGYENYYSFVKMAAEKKLSLFPELAGQAFNNLLFTKSISLKGSQKRKEAFLNTNDENINRLYEQWMEKKQQLIRQYFKTEDPSKIDTAIAVNKEQLGRLQEEVNRLENELTIRAKDFKKYLSLTSPDWKTIRDRLQDGEALVEMIRFQWRDQVYYSDTAYYAAYIITRKSEYPAVIYLPAAAADLDNKYYKAYRNNIRLKLDDMETYRQYWKPIGEQLAGIRKVYFSPDGIYHLINISTLKNPDSKQFLLDETDIQYVTSGTDLAVSSVTPKEIQTALLMGRPAFKTGEAAASVAGDSRSFVSGFKENNIPDLPGTETEVTAIRQEMSRNKIKADAYLKEQASEDKLYRLKNPDILHIATHGYWSPAGENSTEGYRVFHAMANSGLLLSGVVNYYSAKEYANTYDGILTAYEAQNLDLEKTSLVVLSACETSLGYLDAGEGVYGLQRAFRAAGAGSIITSLWKVDDNATKDFMITFYKHYLETKNKPGAFRLAQKQVREKYKHPYFWGAFVMSGE